MAAASIGRKPTSSKPPTSVKGAGAFPAEYRRGSLSVSLRFFYALENRSIFGEYLSVRIFKSSWFSRYAAKEGITDAGLRDMVSDVLEPGLADADLGSGVYKVRAARPGEGKSGGYRVIVFFKSGERAFFVYGFEKSGMDNISRKELYFFKESARINLNLVDKQLEKRLKDGQWIEI